MTVVEKIERYIENTKIPTSYFGMTWGEVSELAEACHRRLFYSDSKN